MGNEDEIKSMYLAFRAEIDNYCFESLWQWGKGSGYAEVIKEGEKQIGFLLIIDRYIVGLYIRPEYRRKGYGRKAILDYCDTHEMPLSLHIVNSNEAAKDFWYSIFDLMEYEKTPTDTEYAIIDLRKDWRGNKKWK